MNLIESDVIANGIRLHVYRTESDLPPLLFAHGMSDNGLCYWPIAQHFADQYEIIMYDSCNHGRSEAPARATSLLDRAHDLAGLIEALDLQKPIVVGHSMGAVTAMIFAGLYPEVPGRIVLEDPPLFEMMENRDPSFEEWRAGAALNRKRPLEELIEMSRQEGPHWDEAERVPWAESKQQFHLNTFDEIPVPAIEANQICAGITCPTLLITGDLEKGALYPPASAKQFVSQMPNGRHVHIAGAGHSIRRDRPVEFITAVHDFLE